MSVKNYAKRAKRLEAEAREAYEAEKLPEAIELYRRAAKINIRANNPHDAGLCAFNAASISKMSGLPTGPLYKRALGSFREARSQAWIHRCLDRLSEELIGRSEFEAAAGYAEELLELEREGEDEDGFLRAVTLRSMTLYGAEKREEADALIKETVESSMLSGDPSKLFNLLFLTGKGEEYHDDFEAAVRGSGKRRLLGHVVQERGVKAFQRQELPAAIEAMEEAIQIAIEVKDPLLYFQSSVGLMLAYEESGDPDATYHRLMRSTATLVKYFGDAVKTNFFYIHHALRQKWGEEQFQVIAERFKARVERETSAQQH